MQVRQVDRGVLLTVRVRPRSRPGFDAGPDILLVRVAAPPVGGRATEEARKALARAIGIPASRVTLAGGARSRTKVFLIAGVTAPEVAAALKDLP